MTASTRLFAGIELGGTKCICLLAAGPQSIVDEVRLATREPSATLTALAATVHEWHRRHAIASLGIASFGPIERDRTAARYGQVLATPKPGWSGCDLIGAFDSVDLPIELDPDVNGAALAEGRWGAAHGLADFVYVTVGTGIGVGTIIGGRPVGRHAHSEAGHMRVGRLSGDTWPGACRFHGDCVEGLASGPAIRARSGRDPESLADDDPLWDTVVHALAALCHNLALTVVPQRIVLGGGIALGRPWLVERVRSTFAAGIAAYAGAVVGHGTPATYIAPAALGPRAGPLGAIALAQRASARR